jgi:hypothetical protein
LVVARGAEIKELLDGGLFGTGKTPPVTLEIEDTSFEVGEG